VRGQAGFLCLDGMLGLLRRDMGGETKKRLKNLNTRGEGKKDIIPRVFTGSWVVPLLLGFKRVGASRKKRTGESVYKLGHGGRGEKKSGSPSAGRGELTERKNSKLVPEL